MDLSLTDLAEDRPGAALPDRATVRSIVAGSAGLAVAFLLVLPLLTALRPQLWQAIAGAPVIVGLTPGVVIGLIDRRRSMLTALATVLTAFAGVLVVFTGRTSGSMVSMVVVVGAECILAVLGARIASRLRAVRWGIAGVIAGLVSVYMLLFVVPYALHARDVHRFVRDHLPDVCTAVTQDTVTVPDDAAPVGQKPFSGVWRGADLRFAWRSDTRIAGAGECTLRVTRRGLAACEEVSRELQDVDLTFEPDAPADIDSEQKATALLRELEVREPPDGMQESFPSLFEAAWRPEPRPHFPRPRSQVTVERTGKVLVRRTVPWLD